MSNRSKQGRKSKHPARRGNGDRPKVNTTPTSSVERRELRVERSENFSGPMPHPDHLERYEALYPGSAAMIFEEFQAQGRHRRSLEECVVTKSEKRADRGQVIGACIVVFTIALGFVAIVMGHDVAGAAMIGTPLAGAALVYIIGGKPPKRD